MSAQRAMLAVLALFAAVPGAWGAFAPRSFYLDFPGAGRHWVDRLPAYSEHLVRDVGAFYLAFALLFAWAALRPARALVLPLAVAWSVFSTLHLIFHATHSERFPATDAVTQTASLAVVLALAIALAAAARRSAG